MIRYLTLAEVVIIHQDQLRRYGGDPEGRLYQLVIDVTSGKARKPEIAAVLQDLAG